MVFKDLSTLFLYCTKHDLTASAIVVEDPNRDLVEHIELLTNIWMVHAKWFRNVVLFLHI
jgi:hypothetical protein